MGVSASAEFERLTGMSQSTLRQRFLRDGIGALFSFIGFDTWADNLQRMLGDVLHRDGGEYRLRVDLLTATGEMIPCVHIIRGSHNLHGQRNGMQHCFVPIP
jgi:hypothetical protein